MNRRAFLQALGASTVLLVACDQLPLDTDDIPDFQIPDLDDLELGTDRLVWDVDGDLYRISPSEHRVARLDSQLREVWSYGNADDPEGSLNLPTDVAQHADGTVYVFERGNHRITVLDEDGNFVGHIDNEEGLAGVRHGVLHPNGRLYAVEATAHRVSAFDTEGELLFSFGEHGVDEAHHLNHPRGIAISPSGEVHVVDSGNSRVQVFDAEGTWLRSYGEYGDGDHHLFAPRAVSIDPLGNSYVVDGVRGVIQIFDARGNHLKSLSNLDVDGRRAFPGDIRLTPAGRFYVQVYAPGMEE